MDNVSRKRRSQTMSGVRSTRNRSPEWKLRSALIRAGLKGWRATASELPGNPDFVFSRKKLVVFVDGCFWHGGPKCYRRPASNRKYWDGKVARNKSRDKEVNRELRRLGWRILRIRECSLKRNPLNCLQQIQRLLWRRWQSTRMFVSKTAFILCSIRSGVWLHISGR